MEIKLTKKAALAAADVLSIWLEDSWELTEETRAQVIALDQLIEQLGSDWDKHKAAEEEEREAIRQQREEENRQPEALGGWLKMIFNNGDQDEMAWKHLGHAFAALVQLGDWKLAQDYERPWMGTIPNMENALAHWWERIAKILENDREGTLEEAHRLAELAKTAWQEYGYAGHLTAYLDEYEGMAH